MSLSNTLPEPTGTPSTTRVPTTPSKQRTTTYTPPAPPETPRRRKTTPNLRSTVPDQRLQGIKTRLPDTLSFDAIRTRLVEGLKLSYRRLATPSRATDSCRVRQYPLRGHGIWQEPHFRSAGAPWRKREAGHRDQSIEGARARSGKSTIYIF